MGAFEEPPVCLLTVVLLEPPTDVVPTVPPVATAPPDAIGWLPPVDVLPVNPPEATVPPEGLLVTPAVLAKAPLAVAPPVKPPVVTTPPVASVTLLPELDVALPPAGTLPPIAKPPPVEPEPPLPQFDTGVPTQAPLPLQLSWVVH